MDNALEEVQQPGTLLTVAGVVSALFYGVYALTGILGLLFTCMGSSVVLMSLMGDDGGAAIFSAGWYGWVLIVQVLGTVLYAALAAAGVMVFQAGSPLKEMRDLDKVKRGMMIAAAIPIIGLIGNVGISILSLSLCGIVSYTIPQVIVLGLGGGAAYLTNQVLQNEEIVSQFTS